MVTVDIQLRESTAEPGSFITGDVLVTAKHPTKLVKVFVELTGKVWASGEAFQKMGPRIDEQPRQRKKSGSNGTQCLDTEKTPVKDTECHSHIESPPGCEVARCPQERSVLNFELFSASEELVVNLEVPAGIRHFPFKIKIPNQRVATKFKMKELSVSYALRGCVTTPIPYVPFANWTYRSAVSEIDMHSARPSPARVSDEQSVKVGFWAESRFSAGALFMAVTGHDTAKHWDHFVVDLGIIDLAVTTEDMPHYFQADSFLTATPKQPTAVDIAVKRIFMSIDTTIVLMDSVKNLSESILDDKPTFVIPSGTEGPVDLTFLLSAAKVPTSLVPSADTNILRISHTLRLKLTLKALGEVSQKQSDVTLSVPFWNHREWILQLPE